MVGHLHPQERCHIRLIGISKRVNSETHNGSPFMSSRVVLKDPAVSLVPPIIRIMLVNNSAIDIVSKSSNMGNNNRTYLLKALPTSWLSPLTHPQEVIRFPLLSRFPLVSHFPLLSLVSCPRTRSRLLLGLPTPIPRRGLRPMWRVLS